MTYPTEISPNAGARIASVAADSPAARAGLVPGMTILAVDGEPLRDILDWHWFSDDLEVELAIACNQKNCKRSSSGGLELMPGKTVTSQSTVTLQASGAAHQEPQEHNGSSERIRVHLIREPGESWGLEFSEVLFDGLRRCVNACSFCFMKMLPEGMRPSFYVRDDDYRLSFLHGNFVTLTNLSDRELERIIEMRLSPLNVSLHAVDPLVRKRMMGQNHARGIEALEQLLGANIEFKAQIVLMPGVNDGEILEETLNWIDERPNIIATGIVPYGYTRFAKEQNGYDSPQSAREVISQAEGRAPHTQLADEFFIKAWPGEILAHLPAADYYGGYPLLEDGIGMLRQFIESSEWKRIAVCLSQQKDSTLVTGESFAAVLRELLPAQQDQIVAIRNEFFGGNVDVAGLLTAQDIIKQLGSTQTNAVFIPSVVLNDDGLTLDDTSMEDLAAALGVEVRVLLSVDSETHGNSSGGLDHGESRGRFYLTHRG